MTETLHSCKKCGFSCPISEALAYFCRAERLRNGFENRCKPCKNARRKADPVKASAQYRASYLRRVERLGRDEFNRQCRETRRGKPRKDDRTPEQIAAKWQRFYERNRERELHRTRRRYGVTTAWEYGVSSPVLQGGFSVVCDTETGEYLAVRRDRRLSASQVALVNVERDGNRLVVLPPTVVPLAYRQDSEWAVRHCLRLSAKC